MRVTSYPSSFKRCLVTIPSSLPVVRAYSSASAELKLTDWCVRDHADNVASPHCATPPLVLLQVVGCPAQSPSVYTFTDCGEVMISVRHIAPGAPFKYRVMRFMVISSLCSGTKDLSCCFLQTVHDVCSLLAHVQPLSHGCPAHGPFYVLQFDQRLGRWCSLDTRSRHWSRVLQTKHGNHVSDVLRICFNRVSTSCCHDNSAKKEDLVVQLSQSPHNAHHDLNRQLLNESLNFDTRARTAIRHQHE